MAISKTSAQAEARIAAEADAEKRKRAARQAANTSVSQKEPELCTVRILKKGDGKVSMGEHVGGIGEVYYEFGEIVPNVDRDIALELEERGFVEIQE